MWCNHQWSWRMRWNWTVICVVDCKHFLVTKGVEWDYCCCTLNSHFHYGANVVWIFAEDFCSLHRNYIRYFFSFSYVPEQNKHIWDSTNAHSSQWTDRHVCTSLHMETDRLCWPVMVKLSERPLQVYTSPDSVQNITHYEQYGCDDVMMISMSTISKLDTHYI